MSRIYEALKSAQEQRSKSGFSAQDALGVMELPERRGSAPVALDVELTVYGRAVGQSPFYENAKALAGNCFGGLFLLAVPVLEGQDLFLTNTRTLKEQICRVVNVRVQDAQTSEVSVEFPFPNPEFWQIPVSEDP